MITPLKNDIRKLERVGACMLITLFNIVTNANVSMIQSWNESESGRLERFEVVYFPNKKDPEYPVCRTLIAFHTADHQY
jgi:hypothetical protein